MSSRLSSSPAVGVPARIDSDPLTSVARGTGKFLDDLEIFSKLLTADDEG